DRRYGRELLLRLRVQSVGRLVWLELLPAQLREREQLSGDHRDAFGGGRQRGGNTRPDLAADQRPDVAVAPKDDREVHGRVLIFVPPNNFRTCNVDEGVMKTTAEGIDKPIFE